MTSENTISSVGRFADQFSTLDTARPVWDRFFTVAPLVLIGTREGDGFNLAPKHMVTPLGWQNFFGFVCSPHHGTYHNAKHHGAFTVSFPTPSQVVLTSLTAEQRCDTPGNKPVLDALPTIPATVVDGVFLADAYLLFECELHSVQDHFGPNSLIVGEIVAAHVRRGFERSSEVDEQQQVFEHPLLAYVHPGRYAVIKESMAFPFPAGFSK